MDFFQAQDQARRNTGWLVILFILAIIVLVVIANVMVIVTLGCIDHGSAASWSAMVTLWPRYWGALWWSLNKITWHYLGDHSGEGQHLFARHTTLGQQKPACVLLLSMLIHSEKAAPLDAQATFSAAQLLLGLQGISLLPKSEIKLSALDEVITTLANLKHASKQLLLKS